MNSSLLLLGVHLCLAGCTQPPPDPPEIDSHPVRHPVHFQISNQSSRHDPVCVRVRFDDEVVFAGECVFETGHTDYPALIQAPEGLHLLKVENCSMEVTYERQVKVTAESWIAIDYWYQAPHHGVTSPPKFTARIFRQAPGRL